MSAILFDPTVQGLCWFWSRLRVPEVIWDELLVRHDEQIGYQEFLAVLLGLSTWDLSKSIVSVFIDNIGVQCAIMRGSSSLPEINIAVGKLHFVNASLNRGVWTIRVESKANIADGPTRDDFTFINECGAAWCHPRLPAWAYDVWLWPESFDSRWML